MFLKASEYLLKRCNLLNLIPETVEKINLLINNSGVMFVFIVKSSELFPFRSKQQRSFSQRRMPGQEVGVVGSCGSFYPLSGASTEMKQCLLAIP